MNTPELFKVMDTDTEIESIENKNDLVLSKGKCHNCLKEFELFELEVHFVTCPERLFECDKCLKVLKSQENLKRNHDIEALTCKHCDQIFTTKGSLTKHENDIHSNLQKFKCNFCNKEFQSREKLKTSCEWSASRYQNLKM